MDRGRCRHGDVGSAGVPRRAPAGVSCGFRSGYDTFTRVLGTEAEIRITDPFHPNSDDELTVVRDGEFETQPAPTSGEMSFTPAIRHIHRVIRGLEEPRHLAVDEAMGNAQAIGALLGSARSRA